MASQHEYVNTFNINCGMKLLIHSQTSTVRPLKFVNGYVMSPHILLDMRLFIHAGIKVNPWSQIDIFLYFIMIIIIIASMNKHNLSYYHHQIGSMNYYPLFHPLWSIDVIWWHRSRSPLAQVMYCCLTAPSHYLKQCWFVTSKVFFASEGSLTGNTIFDMGLKINYSRVQSHTPGSNVLEVCSSSTGQYIRYSTAWYRMTPEYIYAVMILNFSWH